MDWPTEVVSDIARRRSVVFVGAGVSRNSVNSAGRRPSTWAEFLKNAIDTLTSGKTVAKELIKKWDYLTACEIIKNKLGRDAYVRMLREEFLTPQYEAADIHKHIFSLDSRIVATPNFDKIYETYASHESRGSIVVKNHHDRDVSELIREEGRLILKIHGTVDTPSHMIFTRTEYAAARTHHRDFYDMLDALVLTHTFIFLGCGLSDPDVSLLLENSFYKHPTARKHFIVMPRGALKNEVKEVVESSMNLKVLEYSPKDNHKELTDSLLALSTEVEVQRENLKITGNW